MKWEDRITQLLKKKSINQEEYNEFVEIGNSLTNPRDIDLYKDFGEGIYLLLEPNVKIEDF